MYSFVASMAVWTESYTDVHGCAGSLWDSKCHYNWQQHVSGLALGDVPMKPGITGCSIGLPPNMCCAGEA